MKKGDWFVELDLKDAYLTIPLHPDHQKFLRFEWRGKVYQYVCMAFGLAPAPRVFNKLLKVVVAYLRCRGFRLVIYLDDILIMNSSKEGALADLKVVTELLEL